MIISIRNTRFGRRLTRVCRALPLSCYSALGEKRICFEDMEELRGDKTYNLCLSDADILRILEERQRHNEHFGYPLALPARKDSDITER